MRILNVAAGVLLIAAGIYCLCNQDVALLSAGLLLGIFLLLSGVAEIVVFAAASGVMLGSGWLLLDGILTVIMSLFLLFNQWFTMLSLPFLFTLWLLFSGVSQCVSSFDLRALGVRAWGWILAVGILLTLAGFICLMDPWVSVAAMGMTARMDLASMRLPFLSRMTEQSNKPAVLVIRPAGRACTPSLFETVMVLDCMSVDFLPCSAAG